MSWNSKICFKGLPLKFLWELCNRWLIHVKHILRGHCPSMTSGLVRHTTTYHSHLDIYDGSRGGDSEYLGLESDFVGLFSELDFFFPTCPNAGRVSTKFTGPQPSVLIYKRNGGLFVYRSKTQTNTDILMKNGWPDAANSVCYSDFHFYTFSIFKTIQITIFIFDH